MNRAMNRVTCLLLLLCFSGFAETVVFENVNVVPMDRERILKDQTVVVQDGRIAEIGSNVKTPAGAVRVPAKGKFLMPGFAEMHGHLPDASVPQAEAEKILYLYVANGVTTVRGMLGAPNQLELRRNIASGKIIGPTLHLAGPALSGKSTPDPSTAAKMVRDQKNAGYDLIKIQEGLKREVYDAIAKTAKEMGIPFAGHVPDEVGLLHAIESGQKSVDHLDNFVEALAEDAPGDKPAALRADESKLPGLVGKVREAGVYNVPTMALWEIFHGDEAADSLRKRDDLKYMAKETIESWSRRVREMRSNANPQAGKRTLELRNKILRGLYDGGAKIVFGTDSPQLFSVPGFSIHREMRMMVECGMSPYDVLVSGTKTVAEYFGARKEMGTVEKGKRADLILLEANPLDDVGNMAKRAGVMVRGRWLPESEIEKRLKEIAAGR
ncbi:MAG: amidohydrolase family protein [Bryobacteraceae bacterium]